MLPHLNYVDIRIIQRPSRPARYPQPAPLVHVVQHPVHLLHREIAEDADVPALGAYVLGVGRLSLRTVTTRDEA